MRRVYLASISLAIVFAFVAVALLSNVGTGTVEKPQKPQKSNFTITATPVIWSERGSVYAEFDEPGSIDIDSQGRVYIPGHDNFVQVFDPNGTLLMKWGGKGTDDGLFDHPHGVMIDRSRDIVYIVDQDNQRVQEFYPNGTFIKKWGSGGTDDGEFLHSHAASIDKFGNLYLTDIERHDVQKFDAQGNFLQKWGSLGSEAGEFDEPWGIGVDQSNYVYVVDTKNDRIQKFDSNGIFIRQWGNTGFDQGEFMKPTSIFIDNTSNIYVADSGNNRIQKFDSNGMFLQEWEIDEIAGPGEAEGLAVDNEGRLYVGDVEHDRIIVIPS